MLVEKLSLQTGKSIRELLDFSRSAGRRYKTYPVEKRTGGYRLIEQPARPVKTLQRWLTRAVFSRYMIHPSSMGYREGVSIADNARLHAPFKYTLRIDFEKFFWSFTCADVVVFLNDHKIAGLDLSDVDIEFISGIVTTQGRLAMGAPSSPILTNIIMYQLDCDIAAIALAHKAVYTRYADDLFCSSNWTDSSRAIEMEIRRCVEKTESPRLHINPDKTLFLSKKFRRSVTGLVVSTDGKISLGRDRKKMIKALIHRAMSMGLTGEDRSRLSGYLNWAAAMEPEFLGMLNRKYTADVVLTLRKSK